MTTTRVPIVTAVCTNVNAVVAKALVAGTLLGVLALAPLAHAATPATPTTIDAAAVPVDTVSTLSVSGRARVSREPDFAEIGVGVLIQEDKAVDATSRAADAMSKIVAAIKALKLEGEELQTSGVTLTPRYSPYRAEQAQKIIGYDASLTLGVRTTDLKAVSRVMDAALGAGANRIDGLSFEIKDAIETREEAIRLAAAAAKRKAATLADAMGVRLVSILNVSETGSAMPRIYTANRVANLSSGEGFAHSGDDTSPIEPGKVEVWGDVSVVYVIAPRE
ncbi:MAG: SIMPL domain-containing protein [Phycisphaerales bacterium]|nr:MAG: SIMPL domain-containing protein [Phycisphaerales bacterium]